MHWKKLLTDLQQDFSECQITLKCFEENIVLKILNEEKNQQRNFSRQTTRNALNIARFKKF